MHVTIIGGILFAAVGMLVYAVTSSYWSGADLKSMALRYGIPLLVAAGLVTVVAMI